VSPSDQEQPGQTAASTKPAAQTGFGRAATASRPAGGTQPPRTSDAERAKPRSSSAPSTRPGTSSPAPAPGRPAQAKRPAPKPQPAGPRRVRLTVSRVDPWSIMKLSFLLSVAIGIALVVAAGVLWTVLEGMGVFSDVNRVVGEILADPTFDVNNFVGFSKVLSFATVLAVVDVVLITAIATLGAFLYNLASTLVGGLHVTLSDD
jgi:hypothetical protein